MAEGGRDWAGGNNESKRRKQEEIKYKSREATRHNVHSVLGSVKGSVRGM